MIAAVVFRSPATTIVSGQEKRVYTEISFHEENLNYLYSNFDF